MSKKKFIYPHLAVNRKKPLNLIDSDNYLFSHEYEKTIPPSYIRILRNPTVINETILYLKKLRIFSKETFYGSHTLTKKVKDTIKNIIKSDNETHQLDRGIWIVDSKSQNFGHWMIDSLCRYYLVPKEYRSYKVLLPEKFKIDWIIEMLEYLDIPFKFLDKNKKYIVNELILTSKAHPSGNYNPEIVNEIRELFLKENINNEIKPKRKVWASRANIGRNPKNLNEIEKILNKFNFEILPTEKLSLKEKIEIFSNTELFSGTHGSGFINLFFMKEGSRIFEVRDLNDKHKNAVFSLAAALGIDYFYMEREKSLLEGGQINSLIFEKKLQACLNDF